jgi:hypothetical protein
MIKTFEEARLLVLDLKICTIYDSAKTELPSLWEHVDLPEKQPGEKGWGEKVSAVWDWKNRLPAEFPDEIFYGKVKGGFAVLMAMDYLRDIHFQGSLPTYRAAESSLCVDIFEKIRVEPWDTTSLRNEMIQEYGCSKSQFDTALKNLQISMNVVRSNDPDIERDTWLTFQEQYPDIWNLHVAED